MVINDAFKLLDLYGPGHKGDVLPGTPLKLSVLDNPVYYEPKHSIYIQKCLFKVEDGSINQLAISLPPRHNKSELVSVYWVIHMLNRYPWLKVAIASYSIDFASKWVRKIRDFFKEFKPDMLNPTKQTQYEFETTSRGGVLASSPGSTLTGRGINILILDDLIKNSEEANSPTIQQRNLEWYESTATTRLEQWNNGEKDLLPGTVMVGTLWNTQDLLWTIPDESDWAIIRLPALAEENDPLGRKVGEALWPEKFSREYLLKKMKVHGRYYWSSMYQCHPMVYGGHVLRDEWIQFQNFNHKQIQDTIMAIDPAISTLESADDTAIVVLSSTNHGKFWIRDFQYGKWDFKTQIKKIMEVYRHYKPTRIISEAISYQRALAETLIQDYNIPVHQIKNRGNKNSRLLNLVPLFESGKIILNHGSWNDYFIQQYLQWSPENKNAKDDLLDALETAVNTVNRGCNPYTVSNKYYVGSEGYKKGFKRLPRSIN
ncbi:MAG: phage terminase large subunit [Euryarchaeota archaeon]|nr:phage terminase large subunit [Euryarchaeota archaeon]MBU4608204.1 phage terminase large subunit [Euryarchaeota archaeon]MBV1729504.1 phage terminase large subunit [Methanobacterium sp.]MBV1754861.1 phage terminase large subunit [Methanobacterium sp.]